MADGNQLDVEATIKATQEARRRQSRARPELQRRATPLQSKPDATPVPPLGMQAPGSAGPAASELSARSKYDANRRRTPGP